MKHVLRTLLLMGLLSAFGFSSQVDTKMGQNTWVKIADRTITYTIDHTEITLDAIPQSSAAFRVKVKKGAVNLHKCTIYYNNGQLLDVDILNSIPQGGESKIIELPADHPPVTKLVFTYDTKNRAIQKAELEFWGRTN